MFLHFQLLFKNKRKLTYRKTNHRKSKLLLQESTNIDNDYSKNKKNTYKILFTAVPQCHIPFWSYSFCQKNLILT